MDGLTKAMEDAPFWTALVTAVGAALSALGLRGAGAKIQAWARERGGESEVLKALRGIERAVRDEGEKTRKALHQSSHAAERRLEAAEARIADVVRDGRRP